MISGGIIIEFLPIFFIVKVAIFKASSGGSGPILGVSGYT